MRKQKQKDPLNLQSYKIDTSQIESKIHELDQLKSDLKSSISRQKEQESQRIQELKDLNIENQRLRKENKQLKDTSKTQHQLIQQLQKQLMASQELVDNLQQELQTHEERRRQLQNQYQGHLERLKRQNHFLQNRQQALKESKVVEVNNGNQFNNMINQFQEQSRSQSDSSLPSSSKTKIKRITRSYQSPQRSVRNSVQPKDKYKISNNIPQHEEESNISAEDVFLQMIRILYKQLQTIELKARDLDKLPIVDSFMQVKLPTKNDVIRLLSNYPFQIRQNQKINGIYDFIVKEIERKGRMITGEHIIWEIASAVEQIQYERDVSLQSGVSSAFISQSDMMPSHLASSGFRRISKAAIGMAQERTPFIYSEPIEEGESESSDRFHMD